MGTKIYIDTMVEFLTHKEMVSVKNRSWKQSWQLTQQAVYFITAKLDSGTSGTKDAPLDLMVDTVMPIPGSLKMTPVINSLWSNCSQLFSSQR